MVGGRNLENFRKGMKTNSKHKNQDNGYLRWERQEYEMGQTVWKDVGYYKAPSSSFRDLVCWCLLIH